MPRSSIESQISREKIGQNDGHELDGDGSYEHGGADQKFHLGLDR